METKVCRCCKTEKPLSEFFHSKRNAGGFQTACKVCMKAMNAEWRKNNKDKDRARAREYRNAHLEKYREIARAAAKKMAQATGFKEKRARQAKVERDNLSDNYIKSVLIQGTSLKREQLTKEVIEMKRQEMILNRLVKQLNSVIKEKQNEH